MKIITLTQAYHILEDASAVVVDDDTLVYPSLDMISGDEDNEFLYLQWESDGGRLFNLKFNEGDNQEVKIVGSSMFLYDTDANGEEDHTQITILTTKELE